MYVNLSCSDHRHGKNGFALLIVMLLLTVIVFPLRALLVNTDSGQKGAQNSVLRAQTENTAEWANDMGLRFLQDFVETGRKRLILGADISGNAIHTAQHGEYELAQQLFEGNPSLGSAGLQSNDLVDVLSLNNSLWSFKPFGNSGSTVTWEKNTGDSPSRNFLTLSLSQTQSPSSLRPFVTRAMIKPLSSSQESGTGTITVAYEYVIASKSAKTSLGNPSDVISNTQLDSYMPFVPTLDSFVELDISQFSASNYSRVSSCVPSESIPMTNTTFRQDGDVKYYTGTFEVKLYAPALHSPVTAFKPVYPPSSSSYSYNGGNPLNTPYFMTVSADQSQIILSRQGGIEIIDAATGANTTVSIPLIGPKNTTATATVYRLWAQDYCGADQKKFCLLWASGLYNSQALNKPSLIIVDIDPDSAGYLSYTTSVLNYDRLIYLYGFPGSDNIMMSGEYNGSTDKVVVNYNVATGVDTYLRLNTLWNSSQPGSGTPTLQQHTLRINNPGETPKLLVKVHRNQSGTTPASTIHAFIKLDPYSATPLAVIQGPTNSPFVHTNSVYIAKTQAYTNMVREVWSTVAGTNNSTGKYYKNDFRAWPPTFSSQITGFVDSTMWFPAISDYGDELSVIQLLPDSRTVMRRYAVEGNTFTIDRELEYPMFPVNTCLENAFYYPDGYYYALCSDFKIIRLDVPTCSTLTGT